MDKNLTITNQNSKLTLSKTRSLLDITNKLLSKKDIDTLIENFEFKHFLKYEGHSELVNSVTISPDGKYIVSGSGDKTIKIWDIKTGECLNTLEGHSYWVNSVTISPDGKYIVSGSRDKTIKIWDIRKGVCIYTLDYSYEISIDSNGYFKGSLENIEKYLRVSESPLTQRKLTSEEIKHFLKKDNFIDIGNV